MRIRRPDRVVAALLLAMLGGSLALLAQPSAASTLESYDVRASVRYGCAPDKGEDDFVEVGLHALDRDRFADHEVVLQVGLAGPDSDSYGVFPEGGPSLVTLGDKPTKVRLAGPVNDNDHVFLKQLDRPEIIKLPLEDHCRRIKPTNFGLDEPNVKVSAQACTSGSRANLKVTLENPNEVDRRLEKIGIEQIDYTVLLVRQDGLLAGEEPVGTMISFDEPSASSITLSQVAAKPANFQVRVIGLDGAVVSSRSIRLSCAAAGPAPSSPTRPTPSVSLSSSPPSSSRPATTTPAPPPTAKPTATVSRPATSPAPTSSAPASTPTTSRPPAPTSQPPTSQPVTSPPVASSSAAGPTGRPSPTGSASRPSAPAPRPSSSSAARPSPTLSDEPPSSAPAVPVTSSPAPSPTTIRLVEPRADYGALPMFQKEVALVVLAFSGAMAALVGATVVSARRR